MTLPRITFALAVGLACVLMGSLRAADPPADEEEKPKDRYQIPEGADVKQLLEFLEEIKQPKDTSPRGRAEHVRKYREVLKTVGTKIRETATESDKKLDGYENLMGLLWMLRAADVMQSSPAEQQKFIDEMKAALQAPNTEAPIRYVAATAMQFASGLEQLRQTDMAVKTFRELGVIIAKSDIPEVAKTGIRMEGAARRAGLVGNPMEVTGTLMDGSKFDWASYRGKVVLVDFWATWCGPCRAELPNVKKNYELYHDRGFDVVAISLDQDRAALEKFLEDEKNPWPTLHDGEWDQNPVANYYGVMGIPTVILVGKDGKVVSTRARGAELGKLLESLLGPAEEDEKTDAKDEAAK